MILLAHRGVWSEKAEQNTLDAYRRAFSAGWGVELDVRDFAGVLVIAHDPPLGPGLTFAEVLDLARTYDPTPWIAVNIKADGLAAGLRAALEAAGFATAFVFDMAVPDALAHLRAGLCVFTRHSEVETVPAFYDRAAGIWLDAFEGTVAADAIRTHLDAGKRVAVVSPELHGRPHRAAWADWREALAGADPGERLMLCTDHPAEAEAFFRSPAS